MKKIILVLMLITMGCVSEEPTQFSEKAMQDTLLTVAETPITFKEILNTYKGKKIVIDVWASWCGDCIKGMPKVKALQIEYSEVVFLFLSVDKNAKSWLKGIQRFNIKGEHYFLPKGMSNGDFADFLDISWIPRYMVINENGFVDLFNATKVTDPKIVAALKK